MIIYRTFYTAAIFQLAQLDAARPELLTRLRWRRRRRHLRPRHDIGVRVRRRGWRRSCGLWVLLGKSMGKHGFGP